MALISEEAITKAFEEAPNGQLSVKNLIDRFKDLLKDPVHKRENRALFQQIIDRIAVVDPTAGEENKYLILKTVADARATNVEAPKAKIVHVAKENETNNVVKGSPRRVKLVNTADDASQSVPPPAGKAVVLSSAPAVVRRKSDDVLAKQEPAVDDTPALIFKPGLSEPTKTPPKTYPEPQKGDVPQEVKNIPEPVVESLPVEPSPVKSILVDTQEYAGRDDGVDVDLHQPSQSIDNSFGGPGTVNFRSQWQLGMAKVLVTSQTISTVEELLGPDQPAPKLWLRAAALGGNSSYQICEKLISADPSIASTKEIAGGYTALHWAALRGDNQLIDLIGSKTKLYEINARSTGGYTPMHLACLHGHHGAQALLKEMGADETLTTCSGHTSISLRNQWMANAIQSDESDKCVWTDTDYKYFDDKKEKSRFSTAFDEKIKSTGKSIKHAASMLFRRSSSQRDGLTRMRSGSSSSLNSVSSSPEKSVATAPLNPRSAAADNIQPAASSNSSRDFKVPTLPKKKKGMLKSMGKSIRSMRGKPKESKDAGIQRSQSVESLAPPSKKQELPVPFNRWSQSLDNLNLSNLDMDAAA